MENDKVSVIITTYNRFRYLLNTIESVKNQTYKNIEIIVVNDKSTEKEYYEYDWKDINIIHLEQNSKMKFGFACPGGYQRNFGIDASTGSIIAFCDDDDSWFPQKIELQVNAMKETGCKMSSTQAYTGYGMYNPNMRYMLFLNIPYLRSKGYILPSIFNKALIQKRNFMICSSVIIHKDVIDRVGKFIIANKNEDYEYWLRALDHTNSVFVNLPLVYYDMGHGYGQKY